jgi:hypothetical protein
LPHHFGGAGVDAAPTVWAPNLMVNIAELTKMSLIKKYDEKIGPTIPPLLFLLNKLAWYYCREETGAA